MKSGTFTKVEGYQLIINAPRTVRRASKDAAPRQVKAKVPKTKIQNGWDGINDESVKTRLRQKMATGNKESVPRTVGYDKTDAQPGAPAQAGQRPGRPQRVQANRGLRGPRRNAPPQADRQPGAPANADRRPGAPANADRQPGAPANADRDVPSKADRRPNRPAEADRQQQNREKEKKALKKKDLKPGEEEDEQQE